MSPTQLGGSSAEHEYMPPTSWQYSEPEPVRGPNRSFDSGFASDPDPEPASTTATISIPRDGRGHRRSRRRLPNRKFGKRALIGSVVLSLLAAGLGIYLSSGNTP